jgi:hypothetical protein
LTLGQVVVLVLVLLVLIGLMLPGVQRVRDDPPGINSRYNLRGMGFGLHAYADVYSGKLPPAAGTLGQREGTLFYFLLPFIEQHAVFQRDFRTARIDTYIVRSDPTNPGNSNLLSYASNFTVFGRESRTLEDVVKDHGAGNVIWLMERYAVASKHEHRWPDTADGATWLVGGEAGFEVRPDPATAGNTWAHGLSPSGLCVGLADGSVRFLKPTTSQGTFRWACDPERSTPEPQEWSRSDALARDADGWRLWILAGLGVGIVFVLFLFGRQMMRKARGV